MSWDRSAAEASLLRRRSKAGGEPLRMALLELVARGVVRVHREPRRWRRDHVELEVVDPPPPLPDGPPAALARLLGPGRHEPQAVGVIGRGFADDEVGPALERAGLLERRERRVLGIRTRRWERTAAGDAACAELETNLSAAKATGAAPEAALLGALGAAALLSPAALELARRVRESGDLVPAAGAVVFGDAGGWDLDLGSIDVGVLDGLGDAFDAIDFGGGDGGGGDGGGGDGGGSGG